MDREFANGSGYLGSIPGRVIPKTQKMVLEPSCLTLSIIMYVSRVKWSNPRMGVAPSLTPWCSSYWNESIRVTNFTFYCVTKNIQVWIFFLGESDKYAFAVTSRSFGLVSLFNGISTFVGYLMPKPSFK